MLAALSDRPVGVDIERIRPVGRRVMGRIPEADSERAFFESWVRREARAKCAGTGVIAMLDREPPLRAGEQFYPLDVFSRLCGRGGLPGRRTAGTDSKVRPVRMRNEELGIRNFWIGGKNCGAERGKNTTTSSAQPVCHEKPRAAVCSCPRLHAERIPSSMPDS